MDCHELLIARRRRKAAAKERAKPSVEDVQPLGPGPAAKVLSKKGIPDAQQILSLSHPPNIASFSDEINHLLKHSHDAPATVSGKVATDTDSATPSAVDDQHGQNSVLQEQSAALECHHGPNEKSLWHCPFGDCVDPRNKRRSVFTRKDDVMRHLRAVHPDTRIDCPLLDCVWREETDAHDEILNRERQGEQQATNTSPIYSRGGWRKLNLRRRK